MLFKHSKKKKLTAYAMSLSYILKYRYGNIARDYLNLELRHHQVLLFILFILTVFYKFTAAKLYIFF